MEVTITEQVIRQAAPATLQRVLVDWLEQGASVFRVKPDDGRSWSEWFEHRAAEQTGR